MIINLRTTILLWGFILLLLAIVWARPNPKICRSRNGEFPRPGTSCRGYYECKNFVPVEKTCADGEHFNANKRRCDWEDLYPCLEKQKDKECLRENGLFLKPGTDCKKYYRCCNGKAKVEACSGDLLFDPSKGMCEWPDLYTCIEKPEWKKCPRPNGLFLKPRTNCKKYYNCTNGKPSEKCCQKNTLFNPSSGKCEPSQFYTCVEPPERKECPRRNGQFLKPRTNCKKYFKCSNGEPEEQLCPKNKLFNPTMEKCESAELYTCIEKPERKECPERNGKFLKPGTNCMKYYECSNGEPEERKCPIGTLFNPSTERCENKEKYKCTETPDKNKCIRRNGKFLKPGTNCKEYYKCSDGRLRSKKCERNMLFNPSSEKCESTKFYTCIESLSTTEKVSSTVTIVSTPAPRPKTSTDPGISKSTFQKTTTSNRVIYSTHDPDTSTKLNTQTTPNELQSTFQTSETSTISETITSKISTSRPTAEISTILEPKEILTTTEISTSQSTIAEISTLQPTTTEIVTSQPTTHEISTTTEISTLQPTTTEISTSQPTTEISTSQSTKTEISTLQPTTTVISTSQPTTTEISTSQSTIAEISTLQPTTTEIVTSQPTTTEISASQSTKTEISTLQPTTTEIVTSQETTEISTSQSTKTEISTLQPTTTEIVTSQETTEISTSQSTKTEISTLQPRTTEIVTSQETTEASTSQSTITEISTLQPTTTEIVTSQETITESSTSQPTSESSTLLPTTTEISTISQTTSPQMSSTHSTDHTILKENKEGDLTDPTIFETTTVVTLSPSTAEVTTSAEVNIMCPEPNGYFPHPTDKHKFVGCVGNVPNVLTCPSNLVYRHKLRRCDHE